MGNLENKFEIISGPHDYYDPIRDDARAKEMTETLTFEERIKNMENQIALCWEMLDACYEMQKMFNFY
jgi:hypothetical protein